MIDRCDSGKGSFSMGRSFKELPFLLRADDEGESSAWRKHSKKGEWQAQRPQLRKQLVNSRPMFLVGLFLHYSLVIEELKA